MKSTFLIAILFFFMVTGCSKDKFETRPHLEFKSVDTKFIPVRTTITFRFEFTDKEGDVDDSIFVIRQRINNRGPVTFTDSQDIPAFPDKTKGEILVTLSNNIVNTNNDITGQILAINIPGTGKYELDTMRVGFVVRDKAGNLSDTVRVDDILVVR